LVSDRLAAVGYEVYRTPDASNLSALQNRVRPHLAIVALDLLAHDGPAAAMQMRSAACGIPVLLLGGAHGNQRANGLPCVSATAVPAVLLAAVAGALDARTGDAMLPATR